MRVYVRTRRTEVGGSDVLLRVHKLHSRVRWLLGAVPWGQYEPPAYLRCKRIRGGVRIGVRILNWFYVVWDTQWASWVKAA